MQFITRLLNFVLENNININKIGEITEMEITIYEVNISHLGKKWSKLDKLVSHLIISNIVTLIHDISNCMSSLHIIKYSLIIRINLYYIDYKTTNNLPSESFQEDALELENKH